MKGSFKLSDAGNIEATLTVTMKMREWVKLKEQLAESKYPSWKLSAIITDMVIKASQEFYGEQETNDH